MGQVIEKVLIKNMFDIEKSETGIIKDKDIREVSIDAIVDTGASYLCLPPKAIKQLGLKYFNSSNVRTGNGSVELRFFMGAIVYLKDRFTQIPIMENKNDDIPALIGVLVLEAMDYVVNPISGQVEGNPQHGGQWMADMF
jgi:predicted aspartyl protease